MFCSSRLETERKVEYVNTGRIDYSFEKKNVFSALASKLNLGFDQTRVNMASFCP